ncbi:MAG: prolyl oligopeptidase family serine peptidase, partial [Gammaproteobacteria bacterium]|nr:prolyl oligopeptidase family serine peptidase [Gammaproteobacteria bacterium]
QADATMLQLQLLDLTTGQRVPALPGKDTSLAQHQNQSPINAVIGVRYQWASDSQSLLAPVAEMIPAALLEQNPEPLLQQSDGQRQPQRTLQLLLKTERHQQLFAALLAASVQRFDLALQPVQLTPVLPLQHFALSPDRQQLLVGSLPPPYSYQSRYDRFTVKRQVLQLNTGQYRDLAQQPLDEGRKTRIGPRDVQWQPHTPATLIWRQLPQKKSAQVLAEADMQQLPPKKGQSPKQRQIADTLWQWQPGKDAKPRLLASLSWRLEHVYAGPAKQLLLIEHKSGVERASWLNTDSGNRTIWYQQKLATPAHPGRLLPIRSENPNQKLALRQQKILMLKDSSQRQQQLWAYDWTIPVAKQQGELVWQSQQQYREQVKAVFKDHSLMLERQSPIEPPQLWRWILKPAELTTNTAADQQIQLSHAAPLPASWMGVEQQQVHFKRADGTELSGTLYLPKGFVRAQGPLPTLLWAYPREYESQQDMQADVPHPLNYPVLSANNAAVLAAAGFAVFDKVTMPILASDKKLANDSYLPQLIANAEAAVDVLERLGVAEKGRIAVGGHSYGAFMVANLLAHTDLFAAGIARSGAYNRTLTPFGFQSEQRNLWQQQQLYLKMSPYLAADQIRAPLLLIHGQADANSGTRPQQSELMFAALRGLGASSRLVLLPYEGHHYQARESVRQLLAEQQQWLTQHLQPVPKKGAVVVTR